MEVRLCINCKFHVYEHHCAYPGQERDVITGNVMYSDCSFQRARRYIGEPNYLIRCGYEGNWFEQARDNNEGKG